MPFISSMMTSLMMRSGGALRAELTAPEPEYTAEASKPLLFRMMARVSAITRSSSTTRTLRFVLIRGSLAFRCSGLGCKFGMRCRGLGVTMGHDLDHRVVIGLGGNWIYPSLN